jgi:hypothetical protein
MTDVFMLPAQVPAAFDERLVTEGQPFPFCHHMMTDGLKKLQP